MYNNINNLQVKKLSLINANYKDKKYIMETTKMENQSCMSMILKVSKMPKACIKMKVSNLEMIEYVTF